MIPGESLVQISRIGIAGHIIDIGVGTGPQLEPIFRRAADSGDIQVDVAAAGVGVDLVPDGAGAAAGRVPGGPGARGSAADKPSGGHACRLRRHP